MQTSTATVVPQMDTTPADPKTLRAEAMLMNARTRNAQTLVRMAQDRRLSNNLVEILTVEAAQVCTGRRIPNGMLAREPERPALPPIPTAPYTPPPVDPDTQRRREAVFAKFEKQKEKAEPGERHYTASEIAGAAGTHASRVGTVANKHGLKTLEYGKFSRIKDRFGPGDVDTFFYNAKGREKLLELLKK